MATFLVTGANRGIGLEYCRQLQARGESVIAVCRQSADELEALKVRIETGIELSDVVRLLIWSVVLKVFLWME